MNTNTKFTSLFGNFTMRIFGVGAQTVRRSCCPSACPSPSPAPCPAPSYPKYEDLPPCPPKPWSGKQLFLLTLVSIAKKFPHVVSKCEFFVYIFKISLYFQFQLTFGAGVYTGIYVTQNYEVCTIYDSALGLSS